MAIPSNASSGARLVNDIAAANGGHSVLYLIGFVGRVIENVWASRPRGRHHE
jgi:hypothetical protein